MSATYTPFKGNAGTVKFSLIRHRTAGVTIIPDYVNSIYLNVANFEEGMDESSLNETYETINGDFGKNHFGYRQTVAFSAINAMNMPVAAGGSKTNRRAIQELIQMINAINKFPKDYSLQLQYRNDAQLSRIPSVIYTGKPSLKELAGDSNTAQEIRFEFSAKSLSDPDFGFDPDEIPVIIAENNAGGNSIFTTEDGRVLINQTNTFNVTP